MFRPDAFAVLKGTMGRHASSFDYRRFWELLGLLSSRFARISSDKIDLEISEWLEQICHSTGLDRSVVAEYLPERGDFFTSYQWNREGFPPAPGPKAPASKFLPWICAEGATGKIVTVSDVNTLPANAAVDRNFMLSVGPKAILAIPLVVGNRLVGGLTFASFRRPQQWTSSFLPRLKIVADIFANALERRDAVAEMKRLKDETQRTARLTLASETVAAMAHELSHPLGAILANAQAARRLLENPHLDLGQLKEALDDVVAGERRAAAYVAGVRSLFRRSELHIQAVRLEEIIDSVMSLMRIDLQARGILLQIHIQPWLPTVAADRVGIEQVMINLIQNAADAAFNGRPSEKRVNVRVSRVAPRWVGVAVDDTGNGIHQRDLGRIFQPLFTTKAKGTGMGLAIVRSIVEAHGTQIHVHSKLGVGSTFEFSLPVMD